MFLSTHLQKCARVLSNVKKSVQRKGKLKPSALEIFIVAVFIYDTRPLPQMAYAAHDRKHSRMLSLRCYNLFMKIKVGQYCDSP